MNSPQHPEIRPLSSRLVYQNRWMKVREDTVERADGSQGLYGVVEKPDFAVIVPGERDGFHLVEQYRYPVAGRYWEFPQGSWEDQTPDPLDLARAELREETGLRAGTLRHLGRLYLAYGYSSQAYDVFWATELTPGDRDLDAEEQGLVTRWFSRAEVEAMVRSGTLRDATSVAALGLCRLHGLW